MTIGSFARHVSAGIGLAGSLLFTGCERSNGTEGLSVPLPPPAVRTITPVTDPATLENYLKAGIRARTGYGAYELPGPSAGVSTGSSQPVSGTNLQEAGVDEADRIKSDGEWLYLLSRPTDCCQETTSALRVMRLASYPSPSATEQARLVLGSQVGSDGLYQFSANGGTTLDRLAVVGNSSPAATDWYFPWTWRNGGADLTIVNIADPAKPAISASLHLDGHLVASRRISNTLYLVTRYTPSLTGYQVYPATDEARRQNEELLQSTPLTALLPNWHSDGIDRGDLFAPDACYLLPVAQEAYSPDLVTVTAIDLRNPTAKPKSTCLLGPSETLYASTQAIYLATTRYHYEPVNGITAAYQAEISTDVHKFALTVNGPVLRGSATLPGHLGWHQDKKPFRLGEHEGVLRIVTSGGSWDGEQIRLATLAERDGGLVEIGSLPNGTRPAAIGKPGEQLYAVRFAGRRGFIVTFRTVDPLYVLDLSDPADPFIAGELMISGYSDYLHPVSETRLLGIGKDAIPVAGGGDGRGAWFQGVKISLFDISDPAAPREIDSKVIGRRGTEAGVLHNHHALAWLPADPATNRPARLALPIDLYDSAGYYTTADPWSFYEWTHRGLYMFDIDPAATAAAITARGSLVVADRATGSAWQPWISTDRAVIAGDDVHYVHADKVWSATWANPASLSSPQ